MEWAECTEKHALIMIQKTDSRAFALEFFFRGFMIHTLKYVVGAAAVPIMVIPYCMIHFPKPLPECLGAIPAGLVLGMLSLKTGRIWGGVLIHVAVAVTMDVLAAAKAGHPGK